MDRINRPAAGRDESPFRPARVVAEPAGVEELLAVTPLDRPGHVIRVRGWKPADSLLPAAGDHALIVCAADGGWWCIAWAAA